MPKIRVSHTHFPIVVAFRDPAGPAAQNFHALAAARDKEAEEGVKANH
jgi:hypothetical protein